MIIFSFALEKKNWFENKQQNSDALLADTTFFSPSYSSRIMNISKSFYLTPFDVLKLIITNELFDVLRYQTKQVDHFLLNSVGEHVLSFWNFLAVWISMGINKLNSIEKHYSSEFFIGNQVAKLFSTRLEFENSLKSLDFDMELVSDLFCKNMKKHYRPS